MPAGLGKEIPNSSLLSDRHDRTDLAIGRMMTFNPHPSDVGGIEHSPGKGQQLFQEPFYVPPTDRVQFSPFPKRAVPKLDTPQTHRGQPRYDPRRNMLELYGGPGFSNDVGFLAPGFGYPPNFQMMGQFTPQFYSISDHDRNRTASKCQIIKLADQNVSQLINSSL